MKLQEMILCFFGKYHFFPENESQINDIKKLVYKLNAIYESNRIYNGEVQLHSNRIYSLLKNILKEKIKNVSFLKNNKLRCGLSEIKSICKYLDKLLRDYKNLWKEIDEISYEILERMEMCKLVDTRAIYQLFTSNSKKAQVNMIRKRLNQFEPKTFSNVHYFLENKFTSTSFFIWSNFEISLIHSFKQMITNYIIQKRSFHYFPLFGDYKLVSKHNIVDNLKVLIVENLDTAINLCFLNHFENYDLIFCAGGKVNASEAFANIILLVSNVFINTEFFYFGDYDYEGFMIYSSLFERVNKNGVFLDFFIIHENDYLNNLFLFGNSFNDKNTQEKKKINNYIQFIDNRKQLPKKLLKIMKLNLKYFRELEQNILIFL